MPNSTADLSATQKRDLVAELLRRKAGGAERTPLSFAQERIWFLNQLAPDSPFYNLPVAIRLRGALDRAALQAALDAVVARHAPLRTRIALETDQPVQHIDAPAPVPLRWLELDARPQAGCETELRRQLEEEARRPFDLSRDLMLRATVARIGPDEHVLLVILHHIASDAWSVGILLEELAAGYAAFAGHRSLPQPPRSVSYADHAAWQRRTLRGPALEKELAYWKQQLAGHPPVLELPADHPRPAVPTYRGGCESIVLPQALRDRLDALARREGATRFMILLAAFQSLLHRYTGQDDILVGSPVAGRSRVEAERLIGVFVNTLLLRANCSTHPTFRALVAQVRETVLGALAHQAVPFEKLVEELQPARDLSQSPFTQVLFVLQNVPGQSIRWPGLTVSPFPVHTATAKFDLTLTITEADDHLTCYAEYATDLFEPATIGRLLSHYHTLLDAAIANPDCPLPELPLLSPAERRQLLVDWNQTHADYPGPHTVHELFEQQAERTPAAVAVTFGEQDLTYDQLNRRANQLAHHLQRQGVGPDRLVGICAERSPELVIGLLAILKAGGAYVPLDPAYPKERLRFMLQDAQVCALLTQAHLATVVPVQRAPTVYLETDWPRVAEEPDWAPAAAVQPEHLAYVIYTSGSTGKPKGAMNVHRGLCNRLLWMQDAYRLREDDRVLQKTPFSFDVSVWEFFWPLLTGARLVLARPGGHQDPGYLAQCIHQQAITTVHFVPSMLEVFLRHPGLERTCASLRRVICSGETLPADLQDRCLRRLPGTLHNLYGPTEASIDVTAWTCQRQCQSSSVPIGRPIANTQIYIL
ncbi:MAG: AMP-binding protein, partial [Verrucomicrobia bacterium]|nr:AMP-binding protein [Verrucomicrobiota bacterium]